MILFDPALKQLFPLFHMSFLKLDKFQLSCPVCMKFIGAIEKICLKRSGLGVYSTRLRDMATSDGVG